MLNQQKTKAIIFNFTQSYQFSTRLKLESENIDVVEESKLLGLKITNDLKWSKNTQFIIKKAHARMELLRKIASFGASIQDLKQIYITFIRSLLEQSCVVWHSGLTDEQTKDLERLQKCALKVILKNSYKNYIDACKKLNILTLAQRREQINLDFARKCLNNTKMKSLFQHNKKSHAMETRRPYKYNITHANTSRLYNSPVLYMQRLLNQYSTKNIRNHA